MVQEEWEADDDGGYLHLESTTDLIALQEAHQEELKEEIHAARKDLNALVRQIVPNLDDVLPADGEKEASDGRQVAKSQLVRPSSSSLRVSSARTAMSAKRPAGTAPRHGATPLGSRPPTGKAHVPAPPLLKKAHTATTVASSAPLSTPAARHLDSVSCEIQKWLGRAKGEAKSTFQSIFVWAKHELEGIDDKERNSAPDGLIKAAPSHYRTHAFYGIMDTFLDSVCPDTELRDLIMKNLNMLLFAPENLSIDDLQQKGHHVMEGPKGETSELPKATSTPTTSTASVTEAMSPEAAVLPARMVLPDLSRYSTKRPSWASTVVQIQEERIMALLARVKANNSALIALRGILSSVFRREDHKRIKTAFFAWRSATRESQAGRARLSEFFVAKMLRIVKSHFFKRWSRSSMSSRRLKLLKDKEEAVVQQKSTERRMKEAVTAGREEVARELEKVKLLLTEERGAKERQFSSFTAEVEGLAEEIASLRHYFLLTVFHKNMWRSLWLTHHREDRLPAIISPSLSDDGIKLREAMLTYCQVTRESGQTAQLIGGQISQDASDDGGSVCLEPSTPASITAPPAAVVVGDAAIAAPSSEVLRAKSSLRSKVEAFLLSWVNELLSRLNVQRFVLVAKDDLTDGVVYAAICFALDRTKRDGERFMEDQIRRLPVQSIAKRLLGALKQASRRAAALPFVTPILQVCPYTHDMLDEKVILNPPEGCEAWHFWMIATLFADFCIQQVFVEPAAKAAPPQDKKATQDNARGQIVRGNQMNKDSLHFLVSVEHRSEFHVQDAIDDAAEFISNGLRGYYSIGAVAAQTTASPQKSIGQSGQQRSAPKPNVLKLKPQFVAVEGFAKDAKGTAGKPQSTSKPPAGLVSPQKAGLIPKPPQRNMSPRGEAITPDSRESSVANNETVSTRRGTDPASTGFTLDPGDIGKDAAISAFSSILPLSDAAKYFAKTRGLTERTGIAQTVDAVLDPVGARRLVEDDVPLPSSINPHDMWYHDTMTPVKEMSAVSDDADSDSTISQPRKGRDGPIISLTTPGAGSFEEFELIAGKEPIIPQEAADLEGEDDDGADSDSDSSTTQLHVAVDDGEKPGGRGRRGPYDALVCGVMMAESLKRKTVWTDVCRLVVTAIVSYGVFDLRVTPVLLPPTSPPTTATVSSKKGMSISTKGGPQIKSTTPPDSVTHAPTDGPIHNEIQSGQHSAAGLPQVLGRGQSPLVVLDSFDVPQFQSDQSLESPSVS